MDRCAAQSIYTYPEKISFVERWAAELAFVTLITGTLLVLGAPFASTGIRFWFECGGTLLLIGGGIAWVFAPTFAWGAHEEDWREIERREYARGFVEGQALTRPGDPPRSLTTPPIRQKRKGWLVGDGETPRSGHRTDAWLEYVRGVSDGLAHRANLAAKEPT